MYFEIKCIILDVLHLDEDYFSGWIHLLQNLLLDYYKNTDYSGISKVLIQNCRVKPLDVIELLGAVDELKTKNKTKFY